MTTRTFKAIFFAVCLGLIARQGWQLWTWYDACGADRSVIYDSRVGECTMNLDAMFPKGVRP